jgi:mono/diheme cytochrome c family protein
MRPVADNLGKVNEHDVKAIASFIGAMLAPSTTDRREKVASRALGAPAENTVDGALIYAGACALCHEPNGQSFSARGIHLTASKVLAMPDPRNLAHVIIDGIEAPVATPSAQMPGFADVLTDPQIIALMTYLRANFTDKTPWTGLPEAVRTAKGEAERSKTPRW